MIWKSLWLGAAISIAISSTTAVQALPDLDMLDEQMTVNGDQGTALTLPATGGETVTISMDVRNTGTMDSGPTAVSFYLTLGDYGWDTKIGSAAVPAITAGGSTRISFDYPVLTSMTSGVYYLCVWADLEGLVVELEELNNGFCFTKSITVEQSLLPDLVPAGHTLDKTSAAPGESLRLTAQVKNQGAWESPATRLDAYFGSEPTTIWDQPVVGTVAVPALAPGATSGDLVVDFTIPSGTANGDHFVYYWIDPANLVFEGEAGEANNSGGEGLSIVGTQSADLTVENGSATPSVAEAGESVTVTLDARNLGNLAAAATSIAVYFEADVDLGTDQPVGTISVPALGAGEVAENLTLTYSIPAGTPSGNYTLCAWINHQSEILESASSQENNTLCLLVQVISNEVADLAITAHSVSSTEVNPGETVQATLSVKNQGTLASLETSVNFYFSQSSDLNGVTPVGTVTLPALQPGETASGVSFTHTLSSGATLGNYSFSYLVDPFQSVVEEEGARVNNFAFDAVVVEPINQPDLVTVLGVLSPLSGVPGSTFSMSVDVVNQGSAASGATTLSFYFEPNTSLFRKTPVGSVDVPALAAGETAASLVFEYQVPATTAVGEYYFCHWVDLQGAVAEADENNNGMCWQAISIVEKENPDLVSANASITPSAGLPGDIFTITLDVVNAGSEQAAGGKVKFYLTKDGESYDAENLVGELPFAPLAAGGSDTGLTFQHLTPQDLEGGQYFFSYWIDGDEQIVEQDENNNRGTFPQISIEPKAELVATATAITPTSGVPGDTFTMTMDIKNEGSLPSDAGYIFFYMSKGQSDFSRFSLKGNIEMPALAAGETVSGLTFDLTTATTLEGGEYFFCYWLDATGVVSEVNEANNKGCFENISITLDADLVSLSNSITPVVGTPGDTFTMTLDVANQGVEPSAATVVRFFSSSNGSSYESGDAIGQIAVPALEAGAEVSGLVFEHIIPTDAELGEYHLCYWIDPDGAVQDGNTVNNKGCWTISISEAADLVGTVAVISPAESGLPGDTFTITLDVLNTGSVASGATDVQFFVNQGGRDVTSGKRVGEVIPLAGLEPGESVNGLQFEYTFAEDAAEGLYTICYMIDGSGSVVEGNEENNVGCWEINILEAAELVAVNPVITPASGVPGVPFNMSLDVHNIGLKASEATKIRFFVSPGEADYLPGTQVGEIDLAAIPAGGAAEDLQFSYTLPEDAADGDYHFCYWIDAPGLVVEGSDENNQGCWTVPISSRADLVSFENSISASTALVGDTVTLNLDVNNRGKTDSAATTVRFYAKLGEQGFDEADLIGEIPLPAMAAGESLIGLQFPWIISPEMAPGSYTVCFWIDPGDVVEEGDEINNQGCWPAIEIVDKADLFAESAVISPDVVLHGDTLTMRVDVQNRGSKAAEASEVHFFASLGGPDYSAGAQIGSVPVGELAEGASVTGVSFEFEIPEAMATGTWSICYWVDGGGAVDEIFEEDNKGCWAIDVVRAPDLVSVSNSLSPAMVLPGGEVTISMDVMNRGTEASPASSVTIYMTADQEGFSSAVGTIPLPAIEPQASLVDLGFTYRVPLETPAGKYYFCYAIDAEGALFESDEVNNQGCWPAVEVVDRPELLAGDSSISPLEGQPGDIITMSLDVINRGAVASPETQVAFYMTKGQMGQDETNWIGSVEVPELRAGEVASNVTLEFEVPQDTADGDYFFCYFIDEPDAALEVVEADNKGCWPPVGVKRAPDLVSFNSSISPVGGLPGDTFTMLLDVMNRGSKSSAETTIRFFMKEGSSSHEEADMIGEIELPALEADGAVRGLEFTFEFPEDGQEGNYFFCYQLDVGNQIAESSEENNNGCWANIPVRREADLLAVADAISPTIGQPGDEFGMRLTVHNRGLKPSGGATVSFFMSKDSVVVGEGTLIGTAAIEGLAEKGTAPEVQFNYTVPQDQEAGDYFFTYLIDSGEAVDEANEVNNQGSWPMIPIVHRPDLVSLPGENSISPLKSIPGGTFTMKMDVRNRGSRPSAESVIQFYFGPEEGTSQPSFLGDAEERIGQITVPALEAGEVAEDLQFQYQVPPGLPAGLYAICYWIDPTGDILETSEENNTGCWQELEIVEAAELVSLNNSIVLSPGALGNDFILKLDVSNLGNRASTATTIGFFFHTDNQEFSQVARIGTIPLPAIEPESVLRGLEFRYEVPEETPEGEYFFCFWIDELDAVAEGDDINNQGCWTAVRVGPLRSVFSAVSKDDAGVVALELQGVPGLRYRVEVSETMLPGSWTKLSEEVAVGGVVSVEDPDAGGRRARFYRAVEVSASGD